MQITVNRAELVSAVTFAKSAMSRRVPIPVLACGWVRVADGRLTIETFDYDLATRSHVTGDDAVHGAVLVPVADLAAAVRVMPAGRTARVTVTGDDAGVHLASGPARAFVPAYAGTNAGDFPALPAMPAAAGVMAAADFAAAVARVSAAAGRDDTLPVLTCVRIELGASLRLVATDRYRLALEDVAWSGAPGELALNADAVTLARFAKAAGREGGKVTVHATPAGEMPFAGFATDSREVILRPREGEFPRYKALLPAESDVTFTADAKAVHAAVKRAAGVWNHGTCFDITVTHGAVRLTVTDNGAQVSDETMPAETLASSGAVRFNPAYLAGLLENITGSVSVELRSGKPAVITAGCIPGYTSLLCSIRISS